MKLHESTFEYLKPADDEMGRMQRLRLAAKAYAAALDEELEDGADKTFIMRSHRTNAMWANVAVTRESDGRPRSIAREFFSGFGTRTVSP